ncbi:MAG TPA: S41 family peptidase, partial [Thermoanaerobaculia bacterium]|nr:S41 family peptidase [Thermoanaerobaculia bacterium]
AAQFRNALEEVRKSGNRKLIVDLRGNAGGDVEQAIAAADELLTSGLITSVEGRRVEQRRWQADRETAYDGDLQVLTDNSTAAGAEVFAAAIHGNGRGKLVGVPTYGKAIVQMFIGLPSGGGVQMTVGHYTTPDLKPIKEQGIRPDVVVDLSVAPEPGSKEAGKKQPDAILEKALSLFNDQQAAATAKKAA